MMPAFSIVRMLYSIAYLLKSEFPDIPIYIDPKQQGVDVPCFFIQLIGSGQHMKMEIGKMATYNLQFDVSYLTDYNANDKYSDYYNVIDKLDVLLCNVAYVNDEGERLASFGIHTRDYTTDLQALHYRFKTAVRVRLVSDEGEGELLRELIYKLTIKDGGHINGRIKKSTGNS